MLLSDQVTLKYVHKSNVPLGYARDDCKLVLARTRFVSSVGSTDKNPEGFVNQIDQSLRCNTKKQIHTPSLERYIYLLIRYADNLVSKEVGIPPPQAL